MCCMQNYPLLRLKTLRFAPLATCLVGLAAMASPATSQVQQPTPASENNRPAIPLRVTTRLVQVNVVVNDKNGRPNPGFSKESFTLLDNKRPQRIEFFSIDTNASTKQPADPLPPDTYTNRVAVRRPIVERHGDSLRCPEHRAHRPNSCPRAGLKVLDQLPPQSRVALYWLGEWPLRSVRFHHGRLNRPAGAR